VPVQGYLYLFF